MILSNPAPYPSEKEAKQTPVSSDPPPYSPNPSHHSFGSSSRASSSTWGSQEPKSEKVEKEDFTQPSFSRSPAFMHGSAPPSFSEELYVLARNSLQKGFPPIAPPHSNENEPHPFTTHDVTEEDWQRFLLDIQQSACLTESQTSFVNNVPIVSLIPFVNCAVSLTLKHLLQTHRKKAVERTLATWNHAFFRPRGLEVALTQGRCQIAGERAPTALGLDYHQRKQLKYHNKAEWRQWKTEWKQHKWDGLGALAEADRRDRKQFKRECRDVRKEVRREYRLARKDLSHRRTAEGWIPHDGAYRLWVFPYTGRQ